MLNVFSAPLWRATIDQQSNGNVAQYQTPVAQFLNS